MSWVAGTTTGTSPKPVSTASFGRIDPSTVPAVLGGKSAPGRNPTVSTTEGSHLPSVVSIWLVDASVRSLEATPLSQ